MTFRYLAMFDHPAFNALWTLGGTTIVEAVLFQDNGLQNDPKRDSLVPRDTVKKASLPGPGITTGAAFMCMSDCAGSFTRATFTFNSATTSGGAIDFKQGVVNITLSQIRHNDAAKIGGALNIGTDGTGNIRSCNFEYNRAITGAAIYIGDAGKANIVTSLFRENKASDKGGAIASLKGRSYTRRVKVR